MNAAFTLRALPLAWRLALTALSLVMGIGLVTSLRHLVDHHQNRDEEPGLSLTDVKAAYHGIQTPSRLRTALESGHPPTLAEADRKALLEWLSGNRVAEAYDDPDLGARAPSELIAASCVQCHSKKAAGPAALLPLEYWEEIKKHAFSRSLEATPRKIVEASAHAHAPTLSMWSLLALGLLYFTRWPAKLRAALALVNGAALLVDISSWFLARDSAAFVYGIAMGGGVWAASLALTLVLIVAELWLPRGESA